MKVPDRLQPRSSLTVSYCSAMHIDRVHSAVVRDCHVVETELVIGSVEIVATQSNGVSLSKKTLLDDVLFGGVFVADSVNPKTVLIPGTGRKMICHVDSCSESS